MGCADYRISGVCHPHRPRSNVLHGNVGKGKKSLTPEGTSANHSHLTQR